MVAIDEDNTTIHLTRGDKTTGEFNKLAFYFPIYNTLFFAFGNSAYKKVNILDNHKNKTTNCNN